MQTRTFRRFSTHHEDIIHDLEYDYYGKRIATCSSDHKIKVWDLDGQNKWQCSSEWKAHAGSIWKIKWAHPEFGQIIATCSFDRTVRIWEETEGPNGKKKWIMKATLFESHRPVQDIKFAPRHQGLKLATGSQDGVVRIYEAPDITNLSHWTVVEEIEQQKEGINCLSWNLCPFDKPMLAIGCSNEVKIYEFNDNTRRWMLCDSLKDHTSTIHDVSWAPNMGRASHHIATASKDKTVRIWRLNIDSAHHSFQSEQVACFDDHQNEVWRVEWNATGTILASSGDDGILRFWKSNFRDQWKKMLEIST